MYMVFFFTHQKRSAYPYYATIRIYLAMTSNSLAERVCLFDRNGLFGHADEDVVF